MQFHYTTPMSTPEQKLADARARIDAIDDTLMKLLLERIEIVAEVGALKNATWPRDCHIRPGREAKMHRSVIARFRGTKFSTRAALLIWRQIIGASTALESPLKIAILSADHRPRARNYFGANAQITQFNSFAEIGAALTAKTCTIALLPADLADGWWDSLPENFRIFTQLPILARDMAWLPTLNALAAIDPEPSGEDVSFYVVNGELKIFEGFVPPDAANLPNARFLGTSAKPIRPEAV
jgi:chorismate mutase